MKSGFKWSYKQWRLAKRLGLVKVARSIHDRCGPWIVPTAKAEYALIAAGMLPKWDELPACHSGADPYR